VSLAESLKGAVAENGVSVANRSLPPIPRGLVNDRWGKPPISIVLFYQYVEPAWTAKEHAKAISFVIEMGREKGVTGRGRCATEGLNCTLTGPADAVRGFCQGLRDWNPIFNETDFKITDGLPCSKRFKALTIQKKEELVAYGLPVHLAPSLKENETKHLEAVDYHKKMSEPDTVIIDVRNRYETEIGRFCPPVGGATFIDPKTRNSHEFPKWLNLPETQEKLKGKQVMMYCTGGIRCERFSALMTQLKADNPDFTTKGEFMVRGGVERYIKSFPEGGFWKGKNFLFDRRMEQVPEKRSEADLEKDIESCCCVCKKPHNAYRGGRKCANKDCRVPVLVCDDCGEIDPGQFQCPLCEEGHQLRELATPQLKEAAVKAEKKKRALELEQSAKANKRAKHIKPPSKRIFVGNLPLTTDTATIKNIMGEALSVCHPYELIHWIPDKTTGLWYGSTFIQMKSQADAEKFVELAKEGNGIKIGKRRLRVNFSPPAEGEEWPPADFKQFERPPVPVNPGK